MQTRWPQMADFCKITTLWVLMSAVEYEGERVLVEDLGNQF